MSALPPLPGDPAAVRLLAERLTSTARRLGALAAVLARLRDGATWDGPAADSFGRRLHEVPPVLDAVAVRLAGAAAPLRSLADVMEEVQAVIQAAVIAVDDAEHAYAALEDRAFSLASSGVQEDDADLLVVRHLQRSEVEAGDSARARHAAAVERFHDEDRRCAGALRALAVDEVADSLPYRLLAGMSTAGRDLATVGSLALVAPELRPLAALGEAAAVAADTALLAAYGEGDWSALALGAGLSAAGGAGGALRAGATVGARRTSTGAVATRRLTAQQRVALGAASEARRRRDRLRETFSPPPERATPSALIGGPPMRPPRPPGSAGVVPGAGLTATVRAGVERARVAARAGAERAFLDDWRMATANGPAAQRMYAAGATLEVAGTAAGRAGVGGATAEKAPRP